MLNIRSKGIAVIAVDATPTFMEGGGLPVAGGQAIVPRIARILAMTDPEQRFATEDLHAKGSISLASSYVGLNPFTKLTQRDVEGKTREEILAPHALFTVEHLVAYLHGVGHQMLWPDHGIIGTEQSRVHLSIRDLFPVIFPKGMDPGCDSYSAYRDNLRAQTGFGDLLLEHGIHTAVYVGIAEDVCVGYSAFDGFEQYGIKPYVVTDACAAVNLDGSQQAMRDIFQRTGVTLITSDQIAA